MKAITIDELHRIWLPIITLSWVTPEFGPSTLQWQNAKPAIPLKRWCVKQTYVKWIDWLRHSTSPGQRGCYQHCWHPSNFQPRTVRPSWKAWPDDIQPGHPAGAPYRCRPRSHRGPASKEWSRRRRAALFQASHAAATHGAAPAST